MDLDKREYAGTVSLIAYITAIKPFILANTGRFHDDYGDAEFAVDRGDVLAVFPGADKIDLSIDWEHMYKNAGAAVKVVEDVSKYAEVHTNLDGQYIEICLPSGLYKEFKKKYEQHALTGPSMLMYLASRSVMKALFTIKEMPQIDKSWANAIKYRIDSEDQFKRFRPDDGIWDADHLSSWHNEIDTILSLILREAEKDLMNSFKEIVQLK